MNRSLPPGDPEHRTPSQKTVSKWIRGTVSAAMEVLGEF